MHLLRLLGRGPMKINLEIKEYNTSRKLIFYENDRNLLQAFDDTTCHLQETNNTKRKTKLTVLY